MKNLVAALLLVLACNMAGLSQSRSPRQLRQLDAGRDNPQANNPANTNERRGQLPSGRGPAIEDIVTSFYITQFQQVAQVSDEVFVKVLPSLRGFVQERFEISARRTRALNAIRQAVQQPGSDDELKRAIREFDKADADNQTNQERFLTSVDPLLNTQQQAKVRIFQSMADQRIRQMLDRIQNASQNRQVKPHQ